MAGKGQLALLIKVLAAQDQQRVSVDRLPDCVHGLRRQGLRAVDAGDFGDEQRMQRALGDWCRPRHRRPSANSRSAPIRWVMSDCTWAKPAFFSNVF
jgi:hypothetical protein